MGVCHCGKRTIRVPAGKAKKGTAKKGQPKKASAHAKIKKPNLKVGTTKGQGTPCKCTGF